MPFIESVSKPNLSCEISNEVEAESLRHSLLESSDQFN